MSNPEENEAQDAEATQEEQTEVTEPEAEAEDSTEAEKAPEAPKITKRRKAAAKVKEVDPEEFAAMKKEMEELRAQIAAAAAPSIDPVFGGQATGVSAPMVPMTPMAQTAIQQLSKPNYLPPPEDATRKGTFRLPSGNMVTNP